MERLCDGYLRRRFPPRPRLNTQIFPKASRSDGFPRGPAKSKIWSPSWKRVQLPGRFPDDLENNRHRSLAGSAAAAIVSGNLFHPASSTRRMVNCLRELESSSQPPAHPPRTGLRNRWRFLLPHNFIHASSPQIRIQGPFPGRLVGAEWPGWTGKCPSDRSLSRLFFRASWSEVSKSVRPTEPRKRVSPENRLPPPGLTANSPECPGFPENKIRFQRSL